MRKLFLILAFPGVMIVSKAQNFTIQVDTLREEIKSCSQETYDISAIVNPVNSGSIRGTGNYSYCQTYHSRWS